MTASILYDRFREYLRLAENEQRFLAQPNTERTPATLELIKLFKSKGFFTPHPTHPKYDQALRMYLTAIAQIHYDNDFHVIQMNKPYDLSYFEFGIRVGIVGILEYIHHTVPYYGFDEDLRVSFVISDSLVSTFQYLRDPQNARLSNLQKVRNHEEQMLPIIQRHIDHRRTMGNIHSLERMAERPRQAAGRASGGSAASQVLGNPYLIRHIGEMSENLGRGGTF